jgi:hypothetical protein
VNEHAGLTAGLTDKARTQSRKAAKTDTKTQKQRCFSYKSVINSKVLSKAKLLFVKMGASRV